jgi:hypothetical protein
LSADFAIPFLPMKNLWLPALLVTILLGGCVKDDSPSLLGVWRPVSVCAVYEGPQPVGPDTVRLTVDPRVWLQFTAHVVRHPFLRDDTDTIRYTSAYA